MNEPSRNSGQLAAALCVSRAWSLLRSVFISPSKSAKQVLLAEALEQCNAAIERNPMFADAWLVRSVVHVVLGDGAHFKADFLRGTLLVPDKDVEAVQERLGSGS